MRALALVLSSAIAAAPVAAATFTVAFLGATLPAMAETTRRVSVPTQTGEADNGSTDPSVSANGRFVTFESVATNLVPGDTNGVQDVFLHDRKTGATSRLSVDSVGTEADGPSSNAAVSANGRFVAFVSSATNFLPGDTNGLSDVFLHDRKTGATTRVSVDSAGGQGDGSSSGPAFSANGRFVAFHSNAANLAPDDTNGYYDVFLHDLKTGATTGVSVDATGIAGDNGSFYPSVSANGRFVVFASDATNLVPSDTNGLRDVFLRDLKTGTTSRLSVDPTGGQANDGSLFVAISANGRFVAFESSATNLVPNDTNGRDDIFLHDRKTGVTSRVSVNFAGTEGNSHSSRASISANGRFVAFDSYATNLVPGDGVGQDVFLHDRKTGVTTRLSVDSEGIGADGGSTTAAISATGRFIAFHSFATNLVADDTNGESDIFLRDRKP